MFRKARGNTETKNEFWIGFSDLMTGLMLVFIILSLTFMAISKRKMDKSAEEVLEMEKVVAELEELKKKLEEQRKNIIVILSQELDSFDIKVEYNAVKGTVTIAQDILFKQNQTDLSKQGKDFIQLFSRVLDKNIFSSDDYDKLIKYIHIEGYASSEGAESNNFVLSFQRAQNVWSSMVETDINHIDSMRHKLNIVSRGEIEADQINIDANDRKVVFRFEFYDNYNELFKGLSK